MKKKILLILTLFLILVACGEDGSIENLWEAHQGEVFVSIGGTNLGNLYEKDLSGLAHYEFLYLDENKDLHIIDSFVKRQKDEYVSTEDGIELSAETVRPLEDYFISIPKTKFFLRKHASGEYGDFDFLFWFDENEGSCIQSTLLYQAFDKKLTEVSTDTSIDYEELTNKLQEFEDSIFEDAKPETCHYDLLESASYDLVKKEFVDDLKLEEKLGLNTAFEFHDMKINFTGIEAWSKVDNQFSDYDGRDVFLLSVELENLSSEKNKLNMFSYKSFDPEGKELPGVSAYFDHTLQHHEELLSGGKTTAVYPILYNGDGEYQIHFDDDKVVFLDIKKD